MPTVESTLHLHVPVDTVFRYLSDPVHLMEYCSNVIGIGDVTARPPNNAKFAWMYKMIGVRFEGNAELREDRPNHQLQMIVRGGIRADVSWQVQIPEEGIEGAMVSVTVDYDVPAPLLKRHKEEIILRHNQQNVECMLRNLKTLMETHDTPAPKPV